MLFGSVFLLNNTGLTLYQVPYAAMLAELTRDYAERTKLVAYKEIAAREPHRVVIIDRNDSIEEIEREIHAIVAKRISTAETPVPASILEA